MPDLLLQSFKKPTAFGDSCFSQRLDMCSKRSVIRFGENLQVPSMTKAILMALHFEEAHARVSRAFENLQDLMAGVDHVIEQGYIAIRLLSAEGDVHGIAMPLSGQVLEVNTALMSDAPRFSAEAWLLRILPSQLSAELELLVSRSG